MERVKRKIERRDCSRNIGIGLFCFDFNVINLGYSGISKLDDLRKGKKFYLVD